MSGAEQTTTVYPRAAPSQRGLIGRRRFLPPYRAARSMVTLACWLARAARLRVLGDAEDRLGQDSKEQRWRPAANIFYAV